MVEDSAGLTYGFLSLVAGMLGVMLVAQSGMGVHKSSLTFWLGIFTFGAAFFLKLLNLIYK